MYAAIHTTFNELRRLFFPRWDRSGAWGLEVREKLLCFGCCDFENKIISIRPLPVGDGLRLLLIHEMCHCCTEKNHGKKWRGRMLMAAAAAATAGMHDLSGMLADEVAAAGAAGANIRAGSVYDAIRGCAADYPTASFDEIKGRVCRRLGLCTEEFEKTYRRARRVFEQRL
jgi:hypothetical protein